MQFEIVLKVKKNYFEYLKVMITKEAASVDSHKKTRAVKPHTAGLWDASVKGRQM